MPVNEQSVGLAEHVHTYVAQEVDSAINENQNNGGQLNISREHLTAEPELTSVRHNMTSGVDAGVIGGILDFLYPINPRPGPIA